MKANIVYFILVCVFRAQGQPVCNDKKAVECLLPKIDQLNAAKISRNVTAQCKMAAEIVQCFNDVPNCMNKTAVENAQITLKNIRCINDSGKGVTLCTSYWFLVTIIGLTVLASN